MTTKLSGFSSSEADLLVARFYEAALSISITGEKLKTFCWVRRFETAFSYVVESSYSVSGSFAELSRLGHEPKLG